MALAINNENLNEHPFFKIEYEQIFEFEEYIGDKEAEILGILDLENDNLDEDKRRVNFIAKMNSGKTYSSIKMALNNQLKMIFIVPLQVIAQQNHKMFMEQDFNIRVVHGKIGEYINHVTEDDIKQAVENGTTVFLSVYDSLTKFFEPSLADILNPSEYILVVDESHNLITEYSYRYNAINFIKDVEQEFKRVIYLTGTPEGVLDSKNRSYLFKRKEPIKINENINLIKYKKNRFSNVKDNLLYHLFNMLINDNTEKPIVVLLDDKSSLSRLESALSSHYKDEKTIKILDSSLKNDEQYIHIVNEEKIQDSIDILLTTRVISEGVNIYNDIGSIYLIDLNSSYWTKRQFLGRFRNIENPIDKIYELHSDSNKEYLDLTNLIRATNYAVRDTINNISYLNGKINSAQSINPSLTIEDFVSSDSCSMDESVYFSFKNSEFKTSMESINNKNITIINRALHSSIFLTEKFYKELADYEVNISDYESNVDTDDEISYDEFKLLLNDFCTGNFKDNPHLLELHFTELLTVYWFNKVLTKEEIVLEIIPFLDFSILQDEKKIKDISTCFNAKNKEVMEDANKLLVDGYPKGIVVELLLLRVKKRANYNKLIRKLSINSSISVVRNYHEFEDLFIHDKLRKDYAYSMDLFETINDTTIITEQLRNEIKQSIRNYRIHPEVSENIMSFEFIQACFSTTRFGTRKQIKIISEETIKGLLEKSNIFITDYDSWYLQYIPIIKFRNDISKIIDKVNEADRDIFQKAFDSIELPKDRIIATEFIELKNRIKELEQNVSNKDGNEFAISKKILKKFVEPKNLSIALSVLPIIKLLFRTLI